MKKFIRLFILFGIGALLLLSCARLAYSIQPTSFVNKIGAALFFQTTPTPKAKEDKSVVGSTDGIVIMGGVITLIVLLPVLARRKAWMKES